MTASTQGYSIGRDGQEITVIRGKHFLVEIEPHRFATDASDLAFRIGFAPRRMRTNLGNGRDFIMQTINHEKAVYQQDGGCVQLIVFND